MKLIECVVSEQLMLVTCENILIQIQLNHICDRLWINHPSTAKCTFWVQPKITVRSAVGRYPVNAIGVIYGVLATGYLVPQYEVPTSYSFSWSDAAASVYG